MVRMLNFVLLLSGLCGISYEILYGRILGGMLGDQFAVSSAVLITFLLGIGLGSRHAHRFWRHLWLIEGSIGLYGIGFALLQGPIDSLLYAGEGLFPGLSGAILPAIILLLFPAFLIGCSVPLFAGYLSAKGKVFSGVYATYNLAAAATAILIEFWMIRKFGIRGTMVFFGLLNLLASAMLYPAGKDESCAPPPPGKASGLPVNQIVSLVLVSMASAVFQLFMVKISELMFGPFRESFALVLAIVLFGISAGSYLVKRMKLSYAALLLANAVGLLFFMAFYQDILYIYAALYQSAVEHGVAVLILKGIALLLLMGLPAMTFGATVPALLAKEGEVARESGALLYIASMANVAGFLLMAFVLHRHFDYGIELIAIAILVLAAQAAYARKKELVLAAAVLALTLGAHHSFWDENLLYLSYTSFHSERKLEEERKDFTFPEKFRGYQDVFSINWVKGEPYFFINGYISFPMNNPSEKTVGTIGPMFSKDTNDALVLGLGSGSTGSAVGQLFAHTDIVEINPVIRENLYRMKKWNFDIEKNPGVHIIVDDAIHYSKSSKKSYDMILNTVTSPLYFSSSKLYTVDFLQMTKRRLRPGGIYLTWMDGRVGSEGAEIILQTVKSVYRHCALVFIKSGYFLVIASDEPVSLHHPDLADRAKPLEQDLMGEHGIIPRMLAYHLMTPDAYRTLEGLNPPVNTLDDPVLEFEMAKLGKSDFTEFRKRLESTFDFSAVQNAIEPAMKYDPVEHVAEAEFMLGNAGITEKWMQQGRIYVRNFDNRLAQQRMRFYEILAEKSGSAKSLRILGREYKKHGFYQVALIQYQKALQARPGDVATIFDIGECEELLGSVDQAIAQFELAEKMEPKNASVPYAAAGAYLLAGRKEDALAAIDRSISLDPAGVAYYQKGGILEALGRRDEAIASYRQALDLDPQNREIQYALSRYLSKW